MGPEFSAAFSSSESAAHELGTLTNSPDIRNVRANSIPVLHAKSPLFPRAGYRSGHKDRREKRQNLLRQRLARVCNAWDDFQECRKRDVVYRYLKAVFALVEDCKGRRRTKRLLRRAFQFAGLQFDKDADPFAAVIRCTSERNLDCKTISKYARALRYAAQCKKPRTPLKAFMKEMGGLMPLPIGTGYISAWVVGEKSKIDAHLRPSAAQPAHTT
jgi:hypothetical protein